MKKTFFLILLTTLPVLAFPQSGSYDTAFSGDGINSVCQTLNYVSVAAGIQSTDKIVNFGYDYNIYGNTLIRYNNNGSFDTTFGAGGFVQGNIGSVFPLNRAYLPEGMAIQTDDKIIIMGLQQSDTFGNGFWIVRLLPDGAVDVSFNGTGYLDLFFGSIQDRGRCIKLQNDGKIIVGGSTADNYFCMARLNENGSLDTTFGIGGRVQTAFNGMQSFANSIAIQNNGNIILGGYTVNGAYAKDFAMIRYDSNGNIDTSFGDNGKVITTINTSYSDIITKVIIQEDGKIIAGGFTSYEFDSKLAMVRYLSNGTVDASFGNNGIVISDYNSTNADIALQADGQILLVGGADFSFSPILRYQSNGSIDTSFGDFVFANESNNPAYASSVLIQQDNKIIVCGSAVSPDNSVYCSTVVRLNPGTLSNETFINSNVKIYPNPTTGTVFFDNSNSEFNKVLVYNCLGQEISRQELGFSANEHIDIGSVTKGVYLLKFVGAYGVDFAKIVKE